MINVECYNLIGFIFCKENVVPSLSVLAIITITPMRSLVPKPGHNIMSWIHWGQYTNLWLMLPIQQISDNSHFLQPHREGSGDRNWKNSTRNCSFLNRVSDLALCPFIVAFTVNVSNCHTSEVESTSLPDNGMYSV